MDEKFKLNTRRILKFQLAFENYVDLGNKEPQFLLEIYNDIREYRQKRNLLDIAEIIKIQDTIIYKCELLTDIIGREKFTFYDDGGVEYKLL